MSWWWFAFGSLVVIGLFSNFGAMVAKWVAGRSSETEPAKPPEPKPLPRFERGKGGYPSELWLEDGRVLLNESSWVAEFGMGEFFRDVWFVPDTGEFVPAAVINEAYAVIGAKERARKYGGSQ